jgi:hypothetical protein
MPAKDLDPTGPYLGFDSPIFMPPPDCDDPRQIHIWNASVIDQLRMMSKIEYPDETSSDQEGEACFLVSMIVIQHCFYPNVLLPSADEIWQNFRSKYHDIVDPIRLNVPHRDYGVAFEKYQGLGVRLTSYRINSVGQQLIGKSMLQHFGQADSPYLQKSDTSLTTDDLDYPYCILLQKAPSCCAHIIADDGSNYIKSIRKEFKKNEFDIVAIFTFEPEYPLWSISSN